MDLNISLAPEELFNLFGLPVTNTLFWLFIITILMIVTILIVRKRLSAVPGTIQNILELIMEVGYDFVESVVNDKKKSRTIFPLILTLFLFILTANLFPYIIPSQSAWTIEKGNQSIPLFRSVMSDYGMVLVLTLIAVIITQIAAIWIHGPIKYAGKFLNFSGIIDFSKKAGQGKFKPSLLIQGILDFGLGLMDFLSEFMKVISMSFRLFGNIFVGEVLIAVMLSIMPFFLPLPFMFLGLLSAVVQSFVFAMLTLISIAMAIEVEEEA